MSAPYELTAEGIMVGRVAEIIRVGSWPGPSFRDNEFIPIICQGIEAAGATVIEVRDPRKTTRSDIDILQIHWPEQIYWHKRGFFRTALIAARVLMAIARLRRSGVVIVWMVHNLDPHDASPNMMKLWNVYTNCLAKLVDGYVSLSPATLPIIAKRFNFRDKAISLALRHPAYPRPARLPSKLEAKRQWGIGNALSLTFLGSIRPYKGVLELAQAVQNIPHEKVELTIAGRSEDVFLKNAIMDISINKPSVKFFPKRLNNQDFDSLVQASDYVILPFNKILHSGSMVHVLSMGRAVLTPATPYAEDLARTIGCEWIRLYDPPLTVEHILKLPQPPSGEPDLSALAPTTIGASLVGLYRKLLKPAF